jgi:methyltransferase (TIGR00027 family)
MTPSGHPPLAARWVAAHRLSLERTRPSTPGGDIEAERRLYRAVAGGVTVPLGRGAVVAQRTQVIDAEVARALGHGTTQIVLLGAGADGRPQRFGGGPVRWFEVDQPQEQADARNRLAGLGITTSETTYVPLDLLAGADALGAALGAAGHDAATPSLFVAEDLFDTLTLEATASTCAALRARAAPGSVLVATFTVSPEATAPTRALRSATGLLRHVAAVPRRVEWQPGDPEKLLVVTGWHVTHTEASAERRLDPGAHVRILVTAPDPARPG